MSAKIRLHHPGDLQAAADAWGANCGPGAIAALCGISLAEVREYLPQFKGYMNPTDVRRVLIALGHSVETVTAPRFAGMGYIQFVGSWEKAGPRVAYAYTHWVAYRALGDGDPFFYDVNSGPFGGWMRRTGWEKFELPFLLPPKSTGYRVRMFIEVGGIVA
jgi:hypothetical protein